MTADVGEGTATVETVKLADCFPAATLTLAGTAARGGRAFLDKESACVKWMNCSLETAIMPMQRSRDHETLT